MLYYVFQTVTDSNGYFCFNVEMANDAERGEYTALIALEGLKFRRRTERLLLFMIKSGFTRPMLPPSLQEDIWIIAKAAGAAL